MPVSECGQNGGLNHSQLVVESWKTFDVSLIKQILMYLEMIFGKNKKQTMRHVQFKFDPLLVESAEICLFHRGGSKLFTPNHLVNCALNMAQYFRKMICSHFARIIWQVLHKKPSFWALEKWNMVFCPKKMKTSLGNIVCHFNMHPCAQYEIILTNYAMNVSIRLIIWL